MKRLIVVIFLISLLFCGCATSSHKPAVLPSNASNITNIGNGWVIFTVGDDKFMFYKGCEGYSGYMCITQIR